MGCLEALRKFLGTFNTSLAELSRSRNEAKQLCLPKKALHVEADGKTKILNGLIAVDASCVLYQALTGRCNYSIAAVKCHQRDKYTCDNAENIIPVKNDEALIRAKSIISHFIEGNWGVVLVYDGLSHSLKGAENKRRELRRQRLLRRLRTLLSEKESDCNEIKKVMRSTVSVSDYLIADLHSCANKEPYIWEVVAPFEADHQIAYLVNEGICQAVYGGDVDYSVLGCKYVLHSAKNVLAANPQRRGLILQHLETALRKGGPKKMFKKMKMR